MNAVVRQKEHFVAKWRKAMSGAAAQVVKRALLTRKNLGHHVRAGGSAIAHPGLPARRQSGALEKKPGARGGKVSAICHCHSRRACRCPVGLPESTTRQEVQSAVQRYKVRRECQS